MKILLLNNRVPYPLHDGGALAMDAMIRGYHAAGWEVQVLAMNTSRHQVDSGTLRTLYPEIAGFQTVAIDNAVSKPGILRNLLFSRKPEHARRFHSAAFASALKALLKAFKPDAVQLESPFLASYLPAICSGSNAVIVYRMHNVEGQIWGRLAAESGGLKGHYLRNLAGRISAYEKKLWNAVDLLLPITRDDARAVCSAGVPTAMQLAPYGIEVAPAAPGFPAATGPWKAYHIGAMDWLPNASGVRWFLDEVWPHVEASGAPLSFHFAGRNTPPEFVEGLPPAAFCEGEVPDAAAFIADKHILVVPLRSGGGIRVKILEAMAAGKLVISTATGMQGIDATDGVHFLEANDAPGFANALSRAAANPVEAAGIADAGQQLVREQYAAPAIMKRVIAAICKQIATPQQEGRCR